MTVNNLKPSILLILVFLCVSPYTLMGQSGDRMPVREYTNPDEVVTFDRSVAFSRALDILNEFSKKYRDKLIIDRTKTEGNIGISIPSMHWMDALKTILRVKQLKLIQDGNFYEIVYPKNGTGMVQGSSKGSGGGQQEGEGPKATLDTREVRINAIFFEGNRRALREVGVDWSTLTNNVPENLSAFVGDQQQGGGGGGGGGQGGGGQNQGQLPAQTFEGPFVNVNSKGAQNVSQNVFNSLINFGEVGNTGIRVQALFSAFEADNLGEILASPNVKVVNGEEGRIQVGQDFSIKQRDFAGNVVEEFFSVGTILTVTPQVITQNDTTFIHLDINAERSSAQPDPVSTIINKQQAETQALLLNGEATILAGLYRTEKTEVRRGIPILKDLPPWFFGLRYLFGYNSEDYQMRELVILVKASLEPSVPQRYGKDHQNKFDVLQDERDRMRKDIKKSEKVLNEKDLEKTPEEKIHSRNDMQSRSVPKDELEEDYQQQDDSAQEKKPTVVKDPEVKAKRIKIDVKEEQDPVDTGMDKEMSEEEDRNLAARSNEAITPKNTAAVSNAKYYIIGGSFSIEANAKELRSRLQNRGYDSSIIRKPNSSMYMVTYGGYDRYSAASSDLQSVQANHNADAWIYTNR